MLIKISAFSSLSHITILCCECTASFKFCLSIQLLSSLLLLSVQWKYLSYTKQESQLTKLELRQEKQRRMWPTYGCYCKHVAALCAWFPSKCCLFCLSVGWIYHQSILPGSLSSHWRSILSLIRSCTLLRMSTSDVTRNRPWYYEWMLHLKNRNIKPT